MFIGPCIIAVVDEWKYTYQLQQGDKTHHTKHTTTHRKVTLMLNHPSLQNKTTDLVIYQHSRKLLKMDILMTETCWAHSKWNKIASSIKLVFHSSTSIYVSVFSKALPVCLISQQQYLYFCSCRCVPSDLHTPVRPEEIAVLSLLLWKQASVAILLSSTW